MAATSSNAQSPMTLDARPIGAMSIIDGERYRELDRRERYYRCTQHDDKRFDFEGRVIMPGSNSQTYTLQTEKLGAYVPLKMRRPSSPYRLAKAIVAAFTSLLFGEQRFPTLRVEGDPKSQDFAQALVKACNLPVKMIRARNIGGSVGTSALSWQFKDGKPVVNVHNGKHMFVHEWADRDALIPAAVTECYKYSTPEWNEQKQRVEQCEYVYRRDWTLDEEVVYKPIKLRGAGANPQWVPDQVVRHNDGKCHVVWIQNTPEDGIDGFPDYEGEYENLDSLDVMLSVLTRGTTVNLDPTLVLKLPFDQVQRMGVKKGSDNALAVGEEGDAKYLELAGTSITIGITLFNQKRKNVLEACECVIPDPQEIAAGGLSSVAMRLVYHMMLGRADIMREQYGGAVARLVDDMSSVARNRWGSSVTIPGDPTAADDDPSSFDQEGEWSLSLPPLVKKTVGDDPDEEPTIERVEREPGEGGEVEAKWPPYFLPTPDDRAKEAVTLSTATGMQPFFSTESATETFAALYGLEPEEEKRRVASAKKVADSEKAEMFADQNGAMGGGPPKFGAKPGAPGKPAVPPKPTAEPFDGEGDDEASSA